MGRDFWTGRKLTEREARNRRGNVAAYVFLGIALALVLAFCSEPGGSVDDGCSGRPLLATCQPTSEECDVIDGEYVCYDV